MSMAKHVVATSAAMEGIACDLTLSVSVSDEAGAMAEQINALLCSPDTITSPNNRDFVKAHFSWENNLNGLVALLD